MEVNRPAAFCSNVANECTPSVHAGYVTGEVLEFATQDVQLTVAICAPDHSQPAGTFSL